MRHYAILAEHTRSVRKGYTCVRSCLAGVLMLLAVPAGTVAQDASSLCVVSREEVTAALEATPSSAPQSLDGRLGGSLESVLERYGNDGSFFQEGRSTFRGISNKPAPDGSGEIVTVIDLGRHAMPTSRRVRSTHQARRTEPWMRRWQSP